MERTNRLQARGAFQLDLFGPGYGASDRPAAPEFRNDRLMVDHGRRMKPVLVVSNSLTLADLDARCGYGADNQNDYE